MGLAELTPKERVEDLRAIVADVVEHDRPSGDAYLLEAAARFLIVVCVEATPDGDVYDLHDPWQSLLAQVSVTLDGAHMSEGWGGIPVLSTPKERRIPLARELVRILAEP